MNLGGALAKLPFFVENRIFSNSAKFQAKTPFKQFVYITLRVIFIFVHRVDVGGAVTLVVRNCNEFPFATEFGTQRIVC